MGENGKEREEKKKIKGTSLRQFMKGKGGKERDTIERITSKGRGEQTEMGMEERTKEEHSA